MHNPVPSALLAPNFGNMLQGYAFAPRYNVPPSSLTSGYYNNLYIGDMGSEASGITLAGVLYSASLKVSDIGSSDIAQTICHRHSTTLEPLLLGARSNSNTAAHSSVTAGMRVFSLVGSGYCGSDYKSFGSISFAVDATGTPSNTSAPGQIIFAVTPDTTVTPATALTLKNDKSAAFTGAVTAPTIQATNAAGYKSSDGSTGYTGTITTASLVGKTVTIKDGIITNIA